MRCCLFLASYSTHFDYNLIIIIPARPRRSHQVGPLRVALDLVPAGPAARRGREEEAADLSHRVPLEPLLALAHDEHARGEGREERQVPQRQALRLHDVSMTDSVGFI